MVMRPHGALQLAKIAGNFDQPAFAVGPRCAPIGGAGIDGVPARERGAPAIVVEGAGKVVAVGRAIALRTIVAIMKVELRLVTAKSAVVLAVDRRIVVDAREDWLAVAAFDQERRQRSLRVAAAAEGPHAVGLLCRKIGMQPAVRGDLVPG